MPPTVAACQTAVDDLDIGSNLGTVASRLEALPARVDVACFPEMTLTGFVPDGRLHEAALARDGPELDRVVAAAAATGEAVFGSTPYRVLMNTDRPVTFVRNGADAVE